jgi:hypothetical protein
MHDRYEKKVLYTKYEVIATMVKVGQTNNILMFITRSRNNILTFLAYSGLSIIFTYPVAFSSAEIPGGADGYQFLWILWWFKKALLSFANPYYSTYMFYPDGVNLAFTELTPFNSIASIPLQMLFSLVAAYNILWILLHRERGGSRIPRPSGRG